MMKPIMEPAFNFSTFSGKILDGSNFEPVFGAKLTLKINGQPAEMVDKTWINPYVTCKSTKGAYTFWVKSIPAEKPESRKPLLLILRFPQKAMKILLILLQYRL